MISSALYPFHFDSGKVWKQVIGLSKKPAHVEKCSTSSSTTELISKRGRFLPQDWPQREEE